MACKKEENVNKATNPKDKYSTMLGGVSPIYGLEIKWVRGIKEWNSDGSQYACIGPKKTCEITIKIETPKPTLMSIGGMLVGNGGIFFENGTLFLAFPEATLYDTEESQIFEDGLWHLSGNVIFSPEEQAALGEDAPTEIIAGGYNYEITNGIIIVEL